MDMNAFGAILICSATLMIFSFLYKDNPLYKFAEHVFVGISAGYGVAMLWFQVLRPNLVDRLWIPKSVLIQRMFVKGDISPAEYTSYDPTFSDQLGYGHWWYLIFLVLGIMMLFKISSRLNWVSRWPLAYVIGAFAGIQVIQAAQGSLVPQLKATMKDFSGRSVVQQMLNDTNFFPAREMKTRQAAVEDFFSNWYGEENSVEQAQWLVGQLLSDAGNSRIFKEQPRAFFRKLPARILPMLDEDENFARLSSRRMSGHPLSEALVLAVSGQSLENPQPLPELADALEMRPDMGLEILDELKLLPWQQEFYGLMFRIAHENLDAQLNLESGLLDYGLNKTQAHLGAQRITRPPGRLNFWEIYKADAFSPEARLDWQDERTIMVVDSLMKSSNPRPEEMRQWTPEQYRDLLSRLKQKGEQISLTHEIRIRLKALDDVLLGEFHLGDAERATVQSGVLKNWLLELPQQAKKLRRTILAEAAGLYTQSALMSTFSDSELRDFRRRPSSIPPLVEGLDDGTATRFGRISQAVMGIFGMDLQSAKHSLGLRIFIEILSNLLVVIGVCSGVFYFFFSKKQTGAFGVVSKVGIAFLMMSFGASFGYTVMGRISLAIGRMQDLILYPQYALPALLIIIAVLVFQNRRQES